MANAGTKRDRTRENERRKQKRLEWAAEGLCTRCGKNKALPGRKLCEACVEKERVKGRRNYFSRADKMQQSYKSRKAAGLCVKCGKPAVYGQTLCEDCRLKAKISREYYRAKQRIDEAQKAVEPVEVVKPVKPNPPKKKGYPGGLCKHKDTCKFWKSANGNLGNQGGLKFCHYPLELGTLRPWPADECPGFPVEKGGNKNGR